jgi:hypothetical protein
MIKDTSTAEKWLKGESEVTGYNEIKFNPKQVANFNATYKHNLMAGGLSSGKTLSSIVIKFILFSQWFPGSRSLIGRKSKENAQSTFLKDFQEIVPEGEYELKVGEGKIVWPNGSSGEFWGLDSLVSGDDTGKSPQKMKSHNFHFAFLDQLEELEEDLYFSVASRIRAKMCKHDDALFTKYKKNGHVHFAVCSVCHLTTFNQINSTINPANHWSHAFFKGMPPQILPHPNSHLVETSMLDNTANSEAYIQDQLSRPKKWVDRFVYGKWENWGDSEKLVFHEEYLHQQRLFQRTPLREIGGLKIFHEPTTHLYQIGHDPSEGSQDPCATVVFDRTTGEVAATFSDYISTSKQAEQVKALCDMYGLLEPPLVVPESNGVGAAFIEHFKSRYGKIYERETYSTRENKYTNKLGWNTSMSSKALLIEHAKTLFDRSFLKVRDKMIIDELLQFEYTNIAAKKGAGAKTGAHDDRVMALLLAVWDCNPTTKAENVLTKKLNNTKKTKPITYQYV